ncbi:MAG: glycosyltransferase [Burkholderiaceae bacterium]
MLIYSLIFGIALLSSAVLVATQHLHGHLSADNSFGVQNHHAEATPRIGGVAIALGLLASWVLAPPKVAAIIGPMLLAAIPAFAFGLAEDLTKKVSAMRRLQASVVSGFLAWYLSGILVQHTGFMPLDWLLSFLPFAVLFTALAIGGFTHAINIIDGFNGLASGSVAIMSAAMGLISLQVGDTPLATTCFLVTSFSLGFGLINWPLGKLFLGDGGAYLLGFVLAYLALLLPMRNSEISPWASLLVCAYPVLEVLFSLLRRFKSQVQHSFEADRQHLHHHIHLRVVSRALSQVSAKLQNSMTSPLCWIATALPAGAAVVFSTHKSILILSFFLALLAYWAVYTRLAQTN